MAAGLGFKDFTTGEVLTAADVDGYLMQGVWVFASAAARDAAVTSPQEGNFAYLKDTNVTTYYTGSAWANLDTTGMTNPMTTTGDTIYSSSGSTPARLGIGSTGQVLTVSGGIPSWATPASGGGMTLLSTTTLSGSSVTISSISQSYVNLQIVIQGFYGSANGYLNCRLNGDTGTNYTYKYWQLNGGTVGDSDVSQTIMRLSYLGASTGYNNQGQGVLNIYRYAETEFKFMNASFIANSTNRFLSTNNIQWNNTAAINSITLLPSTGTFSGGTVYIYGVK